MWRILHKFAVCVISNLRILPGKRGKVWKPINSGGLIQNLYSALVSGSDCFIFQRIETNKRQRWCCQLTDLVYDGVFEVLQWLLFLSAVPPVQLLTGWCVTAKALPDISAISALTAVKHGNCSSLTPLLNPVRTRKSLIWPWMALDAGQPPALWALASTRFYVT